MSSTTTFIANYGAQFPLCAEGWNCVHGSLLVYAYFCCGIGEGWNLCLLNR